MTIKNFLNYYEEKINIINPFLISTVIVYFFTRNFNEYYCGSLLKTVAYFIIIMFSVIELLELIANRSDKITHNPIIWIVFIYIAYIIFNGLFFHNFERFISGIKYYLFYPASFFLFWKYTLKTTNKTYLIKLFYFISILTFVISIFENATGIFVVPIEIDPNNLTTVGTMVGNQFVYRSLGLVNSYLTNGLICAIFTYIYFWLFINKNKKFILPLILGIFAVFATGSRGPLVALFISIVMTIVFYVFENNIIDRLSTNQKKMIIISVLIFSIISICLIISDFSFGISFIDNNLERIRQIFDWSGNPANSTRLEIWIESIILFLSSPFIGIGIGSTGATGLGTVTIAVTESGLLKSLVETGFIGFLLYYGLIIIYLYKAFRKYLITKSSLLSLCIACIILILIENCIMQILSDPIVYFIFALFFVFSFNILREELFV